MHIEYLDVVVGAQYGSEGKGHITAQLVKKAYHANHKVINVRVAGPNAGHTVIDLKGTAYPLRTIPVGAAISSEIYLYLAPGSEIEIPVLLDEWNRLHDGGHHIERLYISPEVTLLEDEHKQTENDEALTEKIGSTGKGIGAARAARLLRKARRLQDAPEIIQQLQDLGIQTAHPWEIYTGKAHVIIEGTQGYGLGLHAGHYPQCTSSDTRAIDFLAMAAVNPWHIKRDNFKIWAVARVYPIRVAGNSGKLENETTWEELGLPPEKTTVTQKIRRVGKWDEQLIRNAIRDNGGAPTVRIALTMVDQLIPEIAGLNNENIDTYHLDHKWKMQKFIGQVESESGALVEAITTSPKDIYWR